MRRSKDPTRQSIYKIEFGAPVDAIRGDISNDSLSPKPMTPRRVKRRSVRGTNSRSSQRRTDRDRAGSSSGGSGGTGTNHRSSTRSSRRKVHQNPVTKLIEQQNSFPSFKHSNNPTLTENNLKTLNNDYIQNPKREIATIMTKSQPVLNMYQKQSNDMATAIHRHTPTDPIYYNMNSSSPLLVQQTSWNVASTPSPQAYNSHYHHHHHPNETGATSLGHTNPTYQHSNPNLTDAADMNEYYQTNRPPSVRSSYSNFHGTRPYSHNPSGVQENLFASLTNNHQQHQQSHNHHTAQTTQQQQHQQRKPQSSTSSPYYHLPQPTTSSSHSNSNSTHHQHQQQITTNMKRATGSRESLRFLSGAPPAYNHYNHHTPPDSETTM